MVSWLDSYCGLIRLSNLKVSCYNVITLIRRCFLTRDHSVLMKAFKTYVRPALEYASAVWSPTYTGLVDTVESVQRRFTKRLFGRYYFSYVERLTVLGLNSLKYRRLVPDL